MKFKKYVALFLCMGLMGTVTPVHAEDLSISQTGDMQSSNDFSQSLQDPDLEDSNISSDSSGTLLNADINGIFSDMSESLQNGSSLKLSDAIQNNSKLNISTDEMFDMNDLSLISQTTVDMGLVNLQYSSLSEKLENNFNSMDLSGNSQGCMQQFNDTYGDLASKLTLSNPELPEGFTVANMLNSASKTVSSLYSDASNSDSFAGVKNSVSIGKIFSVANSGLSMPELASASELKGMASEIDQSNYSEIYSSYSDSQKKAQSSLKSSGELYDQVNNTFLNMIDMNGSLLNKDGSLNQNNLTDIANDVEGMFDDVTDNRYKTARENIEDVIANFISNDNAKNRAEENHKKGYDKSINHGIGQ